MNLKARLKYAKARNFAIKKMKKIMAKEGNFKELYIPSTVDPEIVRRQAAVYGKFDARMVPVQPNGTVLTGSAEQGFLSLFKGTAEAPDSYRYMAHNQCFRNEKVYDDDHLFEFDKLEGFVMSDQGIDLMSFTGAICDASNKIYDMLRHKDPYFKEALAGYKFVMQPEAFFFFDPTNVGWVERDIVLTGPGLDKLETHSVIFYGTEIAKQFDIRFYEERNDEHTYPTITACTLAAFPRFLKPLTLGWTLNV